VTRAIIHFTSPSVWKVYAGVSAALIHYTTLIKGEGGVLHKKRPSEGVRPFIQTLEKDPRK
jgi:hypothetical protein